MTSPALHLKSRATALRTNYENDFSLLMILLCATGRLLLASLVSHGLIPPRIIIGGRPGETLYFGPAPGYPGYFRVPNGVAGSAVPVHLSYFGRWSNEVTIGVR